MLVTEEREGMKSRTVKTAAAEEEGGDEEIVDRLGGREVGAEPDLVAWLEIGNLGDGQCFACARDVNIDLGASEIKARGVGGVEQGATQQGGSESSSEAQTAKHFCHHSILDGLERASGVAGGVSCEVA